MNIRKLVKTVVPVGLFKQIEPYGHLGEAVLLNTINGFPSKGLKVIGVTGTNGKTSTCFLLHRMLREAGYNVGLSTTVSYGVNEDIRPQTYHMTSVSVPELMKRFKWMKSQGAEWVILETTSHALAQNRVWGVPYSIAVMTNITHEHLAYHGTFERYVDAKKKLFTLTNKNKKGLRVGVVNAEDPSADKFIAEIAHPITYGFKKGDLQATKLKLTSGGSRFVAKIGDDEYHIDCHLPGSFNVSNALAAIGVGHAMGLTKEQIEKGIAALDGVEGRMTRVDEGQNFDVVIDYAHTPDSFEKLFADLKPVVKGRIITLFGSLGGGDVGKRPLQGEIAGRYADMVILSQEDDRQEDPQKIMNDIAVGAEKAGKVRDKDLFLIHDRVKGIQYAVDQAKAGDLVLLLGKGHEKTQEDATGEHPWNEMDVARQALKNRQR